MEAKDAVELNSLISRYDCLNSNVEHPNVTLVSEVTLKTPMESEITTQAKVYSKLRAAWDVRFIFDDP